MLQGAFAWQMSLHPGHKLHQAEFSEIPKNHRHVSSALAAGHYVAFVKSASHWLFFDDETVEPISEAMVQTAFGSPQVSSIVMCTLVYALLNQQVCCLEMLSLTTVAP